MEAIWFVAGLILGIFVGVILFDDRNKPNFK